MKTVERLKEGTRGNNKRICFNFIHRSTYFDERFYFVDNNCNKNIFNMNDLRVFVRKCFRSNGNRYSIHGPNVREEFSADMA